MRYVLNIVVILYKEYYVTIETHKTRLSVLFSFNLAKLLTHIAKLTIMSLQIILGLISQCSSLDAGDRTQSTVLFCVTITGRQQSWLAGQSCHFSWGSWGGYIIIILLLYCMSYVYPYNQEWMREERVSSIQALIDVQTYCTKV